MLSSKDKALCATYALIAAAALVGTQTALAKHFLDGGTVSSSLSDSVANPTATFLTVDLLLVAIAAVVFMVVEARRLGLKRLWLYLLLVFAVAISVAFPLFLLERQVHLARRRTG